MGVKFDDGRQPVLGRQAFAHGGIIGFDAGADQGPVKVETLVEQPVQIDRLMRPVKVADTYVHDARREIFAGIGRLFDVFIDRRQGGQG